MSSFNFKSLFFTNGVLHWGWQLLFYFVIVTATVALIVVPLVWLLSQVNLQPTPPGKPITGWSSALSLVFVLVTGYATFLLGTHLAQRWLRRSTLEALGLRIHKDCLTDLIAGVGLGILIISISIALSWLMGWYHPTGFSWQFRSLSVLGPAILVSLFAQIQPALIEEVLCRGYLLQTLADRWGLRSAVLASSVVFGLLHLSSLSGDFPWWATVISTTLAGLMFAQAYLVHHSLWLPIGIHFGWVLSDRLLAAVGEPVENSVFLASEVTGPPLLQGPQACGAGLFDLVGVAAVALVLWQMAKHR